MKLARDEILFRGVIIKGTSWSLRQGEALVKKYIDKPEIGDIIQAKLKFLDVSQDQLISRLGGIAWGKACSDRGIVRLSANILDDDDLYCWVFAHELWHLTGTSNEVACDDFADRMIGPRPKYR